MAGAVMNTTAFVELGVKVNASVTVALRESDIPEAGVYKK